MLIFEQGYRWDRWTDFHAHDLKMHVSAGRAYLWGKNNNLTMLGAKIIQKYPKLTRTGISQPNPRSRKTAIYRSWTKLFASNLTDRLTTGRNINSLQDWVKRGHVGVMWPTFGILGPLVSGGRLKLETSNSTQRWMAVSTNEKNAKLGQNGSRDPFLEFGVP